MNDLRIIHCAESEVSVETHDGTVIMMMGFGDEMQSLQLTPEDATILSGVLWAAAARIKGESD